MKAITLTQPWASLVAIRAKRIETRSWKTNYRGPLAIHAAKGYPRWCQELETKGPFAEHLPAGELPRGVVICTVRLVAVCPILHYEHSYALPTLQPMASLMTSLSEEAPVPEWVTIPPDEPERSFGDYTPGRFAWLLADVKPLPDPAPARGGLGLWEWEAK